MWMTEGLPNEFSVEWRIGHGGERWFGEPGNIDFGLCTQMPLPMFLTAIYRGGDSPRLWVGWTMPGDRGIVRALTEAEVGDYSNGVLIVCTWKRSMSSMTVNGKRVG